MRIWTPFSTPSFCRTSSLAFKRSSPSIAFSKKLRENCFNCLFASRNWATACGGYRLANSSEPRTSLLKHMRIIRRCNGLLTPKSSRSPSWNWISSSPLISYSSKAVAYWSNFLLWRKVTISWMLNCLALSCSCSAVSGYRKWKVSRSYQI